MTGLDVIISAMLRINAIEPGRNPTAAEGETGLDALNDMLDSWSLERLMVPYIQRLVFPLNPSQASYTVGTGGDFNIPRPVRIERMGIINLSNAAQPLELPLRMLTEAEWLLTPVKAIGSTLPQAVYDDQGYPFRTLWFWAVPTAPAATSLYVWGQLAQFPDLSTEYTFPPGYVDAMKWNLAFRLSAEFGGFMTPQVPVMAQQSRAVIKALNTPSLDLRCDDALVGTGKRNYNWLTDTPSGSR